MLLASPVLLTQMIKRNFEKEFLKIFKISSASYYNLALPSKQFKLFIFNLKPLSIRKISGRILILLLFDLFYLKFLKISVSETSVSLSVCLSFCLFVLLSVCSSVCLFFCMFVLLYVCSLSVCSSVCLFFCLLYLCVYFYFACIGLLAQHYITWPLNPTLMQR